ncbi:MAG: hypothetical protein LBI47_01030 [Puniceicoccales bacterium]|jgi:hypothetical protein|nr:hypothetical protein [Puniceicoccales bacterium]
MTQIPPLAPGGSQKTPNVFSSDARVSQEKMSVEGKYNEGKPQGVDLNERDVVSPAGHVSNAAQKKSILKLVQQIILKICTLADGASIVLDANSFKIAKNIIDLLSNVTQYTRHILSLPESPEQFLPKLKQLLSSYFYNVENTAQKKRILKLVQQIIPKICTLADGASMVLGVNGFKITKDIFDTFSNAMRFTLHIIVTRRTLSESPEQLSKLKQLLLSYFYNVEKKEIVFKRLLSAMSSTCKIILRLAPQLTRLQALSKVFPHISLILDIIGLGLNHEKFTKGGFTKENVLKIVAALSYHVISCAAFVIAGSSGGIFACVLLSQLVIFFNWLAAGGMKDITLIGQPLDKLLLNNKLTDSVCSFIKFICPNQNVTDKDISRQSSIYLSVIGLRLCYSATSEIVKAIREFIRDSRETPETNVTATIPEGQEIPEDTNENLLIPENPESMVTDEQIA